MATTSQAEQKYGQLFKQIVDLYGKTFYSHKTHEVQSDLYSSIGGIVYLSNIIISATVAGSLIIALLGDSRAATVTGAALSTIQLGVSLYLKDFNYQRLSSSHSKTAQNLWVTREAISSLIIDMQDLVLDVDKARDSRDRFLEDLAKVYADAPRTSKKAYRIASTFIKKGGGGFNDAEREVLLQ